MVELNLTSSPREISSPFSFIYGSVAGIESSLYLDSEIVLNVIEQLTTTFEAGHEIEFNHVGAHQVFDASFMFVTEAGFPILATTTMPIIYSVKGSVVVAPKEGKVLGKVVPVVNGKIQTHFGIVSPFTKEMIGAGVEMSVHSSIPVEIEGKMIKGEVELVVRIPTEIERSVRLIKPVHAFVLPYTFKHNLLTVTPFSHSTHLRKIVSGVIRQPISIEVGQPLGLSARVHYHSDAKFVDLVSYIQKITQHTPLSILPSAILPSTVRMSSVSIELLPLESVTKEFKLIISLSTKGMVHSLSKKMITEVEIPSEFTQVKSVLAQLEKANVVEIIAMTKGATGSQLKKIKSAIVIGKKLAGASLPIYMCAAEITPILGETFGLRFEGKIELPKLMNRWSIEKIVEESLKAGFEGKLSFGKSTKMESIKIVAKLEKTDELKREIRESPEFKKCMVEVRRQGVLSPVCSIVRHQAAALDKIHLTIEAPKIWSTSSILSLLDGVFETLLIGNIETEQVIAGTDGTLIVEARADRTSQVVTFGKIITPTRKIVMKNLRLLGYPRFILPATVLRTPIEVAALKLTTNSIPSTCRVEPSFVRTFDSVSLDYKINDCEHVLLLDGSKHVPIAVTTRTVEADKKIVKILSGITEVLLIPSAGAMKVMVNGKPLSLPAVGEQLIKKSPEGKILVILQHFKDNVISVYVPEQGLQVLSNGIMIEVVAPQLLKSRTVGLCGDMDGEKSADLRTPRMCVMRPHLAALSFILNKSGYAPGFEHCAGIPASVKTEFEREVTRCSHEVVVPTPISKLYENISFLTKPTGMMHIVEKKSAHLCISKQMVKICLSKPLSIKQKSVEFACIPWPSVLALSLEKRALSGEVLFQEISQLPTVFRKVEFEPVACKSEMSSMTL